MKFRPPHFRSAHSGFTMVEIAISLAIIGIGLVAIIGVLPIGMNVQRDNREQTIVNQDATVFIEAIRNGMSNTNDTDLTNYVYAITNSQTVYNNGTPGLTTPYGYTLTSPFPLANNARIIGLLSIPEYVAADGTPLANLFNGGYSNHVVAYVHSISGPAVEKPPQNNPIIQQDSFSYRILCENLPIAMDPDAPSSYSTNLTANLHDLRLTFLWPQRPGGNLGNGRQTFRTLVAGQIVQTNSNGQTLYFFQSQSYTNAP